MAVMKEKLAFNATSETLFVGVGGIGSDIVARTAARCRGSEKDNIRFVVMDTNANDLKYVKESKANIIPIQTSSTQSVLDYLMHDEDARGNWFPNNTTLYSKTVSEGAGQVRAISRLALNATIKNGNIQGLYKAIDELFLKDGGELKQALRVVIVSSAAGGTGSGIAMTVGMLIREYLHRHYREKSAIIRGYLLLPGVMDTVIPTETERKSLRRNGYATIKEINAFMIKASGYCDVRKDLTRYKDLYIDLPTTASGVERLENLPFDFCFLLDRVDQSQESMQTLDQYKEFAAQALYEQNVGPMQRNAFGIEDNIIKEFANGDNLGRNRFGGIGAATLRYPYEDIIDYVAYSRAIACIGDGQTVGEWLRYDHEFEKAKAEFKKKRAYTTEAAPRIEDVYVSEVKNGNTRFDNDIKGALAIDVTKLEAEVEARIATFLSIFEKQIFANFESSPKMKTLKAAVTKLAQEIDYEGEESERGHAMDNLQNIRDFENEVKKNAATSAKAYVRSILYNAPSVGGEVQPYHLEKLLVNNEGAIHPNAMRYMLYALKKKVEESYRIAKGSVSTDYSKLSLFTPDADNKDFFDIRGGISKKEERSIDQVCELEKSDPSFMEKFGYKNLWNKLNEVFPAFVSTVNKYYLSVVRETVYETTQKYLEQLCEQFEGFYASFASKVYTLSKEQNEIVDKLKFNEGDSVAYVCSKKSHLDRLTAMCPSGGDELMLPPALSAKIFDAIKANAENMRIAEYDPNLAKAKIDIFDAVLIDYFKESVRDDCDAVLNMDVIRAIAKEQEINEYLVAAETAVEGEFIGTPEISDADKTEYLREKIKFGHKLAAPGIGCANFNEPRDVKLCAYNVRLKEMRDIDINKLIQPLNMNASPSASVSKYDMRFFNAVYNISPDSLARFRSPEECSEVQYKEGPGIYYEAYHEYVKNIGPDSTKSSTISLHIDKRWDSLAEMPELSMEEHYKEMLRIHSALIYGIVHGMIITHPSSRYDAKKRIYALEDIEGDRTSLVVSNNTECDEFYEVLDALYKDRASVAKIYEMQEERCRYDIDSNRRYNESAFVRDTANFKIGDGHDAPTSIFEIPLAYYNSLPRSKLDDNELSIMIDSTISVLEREIARYEQESDREPFLAQRLVLQFKLFVQNFLAEANEELRKSSNITDNRVVNMVFRKVSNKIKKLNTYKCDEIIEELHALIK